MEASESKNRCFFCGSDNTTSRSVGWTDFWSAKFNPETVLYCNNCNGYPLRCYPNNCGPFISKSPPMSNITIQCPSCRSKKSGVQFYEPESA